MKTLLKVLLILFILSAMLVGTAWFILTRSGVQKFIVESQLPKGSSIGTVRVTTHSLELSELKLQLPDGSKIRIGALDTDFKPLDAVFNRKLKMGALRVDGLVVDIPEALIQGSSASQAKVDFTRRASEPGESSTTTTSPVVSPATKTGSAVDALYASGEFDWLVEIESIHFDGELRDASGSIYAIDLRSGAIRPGEESTIELSLKLRAGEALPAGLQSFDADARVDLKQNQGGGFEQVRIESLIRASDQDGQSLLSVSQELELIMDSFEEMASLEVHFNADLPRPEVFLAEMNGVGALHLQGGLKAGAEGDILTLSQMNGLFSVDGIERFSLQLNKSFKLGGTQDLSGNLIDLRIASLPLAWLGPWLPDGILLNGTDFSGQFNVTGLPGGAFQLRSNAPLRLGPLSLTRDGSPLLEELTVSAEPVILLGVDQSIAWDLANIQITDRYGEMLSGQSKGRLNPTMPTAGFLPAGLETQSKLHLGLQEITQQPGLAAYTSILRGRTQIELTLDPANNSPLRVQGRIDGLSPRANPGQRQDYRFALEVSEPGPGLVAWGLNLQAGPENRPSSNLQFAGQVQPGSEPLAFKADLTAPRLSQADFELLQAAFQPEASGAVPELPKAAPKPKEAASISTRPGTAVVAPTGPAWAGYEGEVSLSVDELYLVSGEVLTDLRAKALVSEPLLRLSELQASLLDGELSGRAEARYSGQQRSAYALSTDLSFENVDPSVFARKGAKSVPVQGLFAGQAQFTGQGATLDQAIDAIQGELSVTGRDGVLTAFQLDDLLPERLSGLGELGRIGIGILGDRVNRPGITALAEAVPYFEKMPFSDFSLKLTRGADQRIMVPQLQFIGRNLLINGSGSVAATSLKNALSQPLEMKLELGAKGPLIDSLESLQLLGPSTAEDGFRRLENEIRIGGTLSEPDTSALKRLLREAANRALREPERNAEVATPEGGVASESSTGEAASSEPTKEQKIIRDVETGLNLLNSLLN